MRLKASSSTATEEAASKQKHWLLGAIPKTGCEFSHKLNKLNKANNDDAGQRQKIAAAHARLALSHASGLPPRLLALIRRFGRRESTPFAFLVRSGGGDERLKLSTVTDFPFITLTRNFSTNFD